MRLIDADKLLEETRKDRDYARKNGFMDMYYERQVLIDRIESQPTAYDMDKVIEKLEEKARFYNSASDVDQNIRNGLIIAKESVQEVAEEYNNGCYLLNQTLGEKGE